MDTFHPKKKASLTDIFHRVFTLWWKELWAILHHLKEIKYNKIINFTWQIHTKIQPWPNFQKEALFFLWNILYETWSYIKMTKFLKLTKLGQLGVLQLWGFKQTTLFITLVESFEQHCVQLLNKTKCTF
jgi:hypothetical protein